MSAMQAGTQMVKLRGGSKGLVRFYFLDEHRSCIRWRPSRKNEKAKSEWGAWGGGPLPEQPAPGVSGGSGPRSRAQRAPEFCSDLSTQDGARPGPAAHLAQLPGAPWGAPSPVLEAGLG